MNPTIESWKGTFAEIGAAYPFVGSEMLLVVAAVVFWVAWHIIQLGQERADKQNVLEDFIDTRAVESSVDDSSYRGDEEEIDTRY